MSDAVNEQLSALLDGELSPAESELVLKRLERQGDLKAKLSRYALIGEALRATEPVVAANAALLQGVASAIAQDEALLESHSGTQPTSHRQPSRAGWWRAVSGLGIAAAVGILAVGLVQRGAPGPQVVAVTAPPVASSVLPAAPSVSASPVSAASVSTLATNLHHGEPLSYVTPLPHAVPQRPASEFANYAVAHAPYSSALGRQSVMSGLVAEDVSERSVEVLGRTGLEPLFPTAVPTLATGAVGRDSHP